MARAGRPCYKIAMAIYRIFVLVILILAAPLQAQKYLFQDSSRPLEDRVEDLLGKLTPEEKIDMISGINGFDVRPIERLGVPKMHMSDGPCGTRNLDSELTSRSVERI